MIAKERGIARLDYYYSLTALRSIDFGDVNAVVVPEAIR